MQYLVNTATDNVQLWDIDFTDILYGNDNTNINVPYTTGIYSSGQLYKNVTTDEHGKQVIAYSDMEEHVVLKQVQVDSAGGWLSTYYIYDDLGRLRCVLPPLAVEAARKNNWTVSATSLKELCFRYEYDKRGRMLAKKVPGTAWVYMVYNRRDQLVFTQDGNMKSKGQWMYSFYDNLERPVESGIMTNYNGTVADLQTYMDNVNQAVVTDIVLNNWDGTTTSYQASNSVVLGEGVFIDGNVASVTIDIVDGAGSGAKAGGTLTALTINSYDDYSNTAKTFNSTYSLKPGTGDNDNAEAAVSDASKMIMGKATIARLRILADPANLSAGNWLETVSFYDDKGRVVQVQTDNYKGGTDVSSNRYEFTGKIVSNYLVHNNVAGDIGTVTVKTDFLFDHIGRLIKISKQLNDDPSTKRVISSLTYDALGQMKEKQVGQQRSNDGTLLDMPLEDQKFAYNIRGWLKGVNWKYNDNGSVPDIAQGKRWFGMDLSYDWGFGTNQYNGNISGMRWKTGGSSNERAYGYAYDGANRLLKADFTQNNGGWNTSAGLDFSMKLGDGIDWAKAYDVNGNILSMSQKGWIGTSSDDIDKLTYHYYQDANKLSGVNDEKSTDNKLGDFVDNNANGDDYGYDINGNLITDKNKHIANVSGTTGTDIQAGNGGIIYNHLNLPWQVTALNTDNTVKGVITYIYDAAGNKLEKRVAENASASNQQTAIETVTSYMDGFVYENNKLQFLSQEEGRIRALRDGSGVTTGYAYDYFLKDHLGNVRMVLTDEKQTSQYPVATLEAGAVATEKGFYDIQDANIIAKASVSGFANAAGQNYLNNNGNPPYNTNPQSNVNAESQNLYKLNLNGAKMGLGITLKVMAGDQLSIFGKSYYFQNAPTNDATPHISAAEIFAGLIGGPSGGATAAHGAVTVEQLNTLSGTVSSIGSFIGNNASQDGVGSTPRAYINYLLFDEQFNYAGGGVSKVGSNGVIKDHRDDLSNIQVSQNGYIYVYCSNESPVDVFFDNLQVVHAHGPLLEETHYYPFGLTMAGISSKAAGKLENRFKYNGKELQSKEFSDDSGLEQYDYGARFYDQQIGRWHAVDPMAEKYELFTPYSYVLNDPLNMIDPDGRYSTHTDASGNVLAVYNDGDLGVYKHDDANSKADIDEARGESKTTAGGGTKMGETEYWDEFIVPGTNRAEGKIEYGKDWKETIDKLHDETRGMDLIQIGENSKLHEKFDLKNKKEYAASGVMTGKLLNGKYATARSAGNYLAGYNGRWGTYMGLYIGYYTYMKLAGALNQGKYNKVNAVKIFFWGVSYGPDPWYGEDEYSGRRIKEGWFRGTDPKW
ncbi:RHS repeat-associated core domain-containing protein [Deminuibacter soli]|uniref:RHS repeat-associated core domain-containing protein n=2 Tax=Deminuibacter soli TaxID=2291815 RepID=A0A3E1NCW2_9BACT|nr:RHS repeat-associated core domain-containing protein [Deminuibacter soli]